MKRELRYRFKDMNLLFDDEVVVKSTLDTNNNLSFEFLNKEDTGRGIIKYLLYCLKYYLYNKGISVFHYDGVDYNTEDGVYFDNTLVIELDGTNYMIYGTLRTMVHSSESAVDIGRVQRVNREIVKGM